MIFENRYGLFDQLLHRFAFRAQTTQQALAEVEGLLFRDQIESTSVRAPVFISGLPRSGTTILLNLLFRTGRFGTHTYRDMPFILCPMLWHRFSQHFGVEDKPRERAHGDGLMVSADSPEAFEEMVWKSFWPGHYRSDRIVPWKSEDRNAEFERFMADHMRKIVALRSREVEKDLRYLSKNNLNIARMGSPAFSLLEGHVVVPFREPLQQAASMCRQHSRFLKIQRHDGFVRNYMDAIGHHEFGTGLRPVDFGGWMSDGGDPLRLGFWVRYWIAAYEHVLEHREATVCLLSYQRLIREPECVLGDLETRLDLPPGILASQAGELRRPAFHDIDEAEIPAFTRDRARSIYERLESTQERII